MILKFLFFQNFTFFRFFVSLSPFSKLINFDPRELSLNPFFYKLISLFINEYINNKKTKILPNIAYAYLTMALVQTIVLAIFAFFVSTANADISDMASNTGVLPSIEGAS